MDSRSVQELFGEVKAMFVVDYRHTPTQNGRFLWTAQGLIPELNACDEVYRNIYIGNGRVATDIEALKRLGVRLVVNAAQGKHFSQVDTDAAHYAGHGIDFAGVQAMDNVQFSLRPYFSSVGEVIHKYLAHGNKVLVHCHQGLSRSATLVLAYLMLYRRHRLKDALATMRRYRLVTPNDKFLWELCALDAELYGP